MDWLLFAVQWLHVLLGITWFGYALSMYFFVAPALGRMPEDQQRSFNGALGGIAARVFPFVGISVLVLGFIRGTFLGPIDGVDDVFGTAYGITWLVGLLTTIALFVTGARFVGPTYQSLPTTSDFAGTAARLQRYATIDLALFGVVFTCMILMRVGI